VKGNEVITLTIKTNRSKACYLEYAQHSSRVHIRYQCGITDLPWEEITVMTYLRTPSSRQIDLASHAKIDCLSVRGMPGPIRHSCLQSYP
jgi:hypothetical protein